MSKSTMLELMQERALIEASARIESLEAQLAEAQALLSAANCPCCDGSGVVMEESIICVPICCNCPTSSGECCGIPDPWPEKIQEPAQCQWCSERAAINETEQEKV